MVYGSTFEESASFALTSFNLAEHLSHRKHAVNLRHTLIYTSCM